MTRAERLAEQEARAKARLDKQRKLHAAAQARRREEEQRQRTKRYQLLGQLLDDAGLLTLSDTDLAGLFRILAPLVHVPDPVAVLASLVGETEGPTLAVVNGMAEATPRVAPIGASGDTVQ
jgi:hypothetical protein